MDRGRRSSDDRASRLGGDAGARAGLACSSPAAGRRRSRFCASSSDADSVSFARRTGWRSTSPSPLRSPCGPTASSARAFEPGDEQLVYDLHQEAFKDSWEPIEETYDQWAHQFLVPEVLAPTLWTLAVVGRRARRLRDLSSARRAQRPRLGTRARCPQNRFEDADSGARFCSARSRSSGTTA